MKKLFLSASALFALTAVAVGSASAADLRMPAYRAAPVVVAPLSWTGFYVGLNGGGSIGVSTTTDTGTFAGLPPASGPPAGTLFSTDYRRTPTGGLFGGQLGYNWQMGPSFVLGPNFVLGLEADWQGAWQKDTALVGSCNTPGPLGGLAPPFFPGPAAVFPRTSYCLSAEQKLTNFGTARARGGYLIHDTLWYVTGGFAWGTVQNNLALTNPAAASQTGFNFPVGSVPAIFGGTGSFSHRQGGWTIGGGVESRIWGAWSLKLEYLYVDLRDMTDTFGLAVNPKFIATNPTILSGLAAGVTSDTHFTDNIIRVGLNYRFGYAPFVTRY